MTVPLTTSTGSGGFAATGEGSTWAGCVTTGLAFGFSVAEVLALGCDDAFEVAGGGVFFTVEFETVGAVTGRGFSTGRIS